MSKKPGYINPHSRGKSRNIIEDYRSQEETPVERTQELTAPCPKCKGSGEEQGRLRGERVTLTCIKCGGDGVI
jgi:DnaJ-class molecular chaperone